MKEHWILITFMTKLFLLTFSPMFKGNSTFNLSTHSSHLSLKLWGLKDKFRTITLSTVNVTLELSSSKHTNKCLLLRLYLRTQTKSLINTKLHGIFTHGGGDPLRLSALFSLNSQFARFIFKVPKLISNKIDCLFNVEQVCLFCESEV